MGVVAVIGAGTMGRGIGQLVTNHGYDLVLFDVDVDRVRAAAEHVRQHGQRAGSGSQPDHSQSLPSIRVGNSIEDAVAGAEVVIECVPERMPLKTDVLSTIALAAPKDCLFVSNTSTFSIGGLATAAGCSDRLVGMHFFNPPEKMRLIEVIQASGVAAIFVTQAVEFAHSLEKTPIVIKDSPGFVTSRLGLVLGNEAMRLVESGVASVNSIDTAMRLGYNHPMGPLELADLVGLDARLNNVRSLYSAIPRERFEPPAILVDLVAAGHLGRKSGRGFYFYDADGHKLLDAVGIASAEPSPLGSPPRGPRREGAKG